MKKTLYLISVITVISIFFSGCVTKQKYMELEKKYNDCTSDKLFATNELSDCQNKSRDLDKELTTLKNKVEQLKQDTLSLTHKLQQSEQDYAKAKKDYDDLVKEIVRMNRDNSSVINELTGNLDSIKSQLDNKERELQALQVRLNEQAEELSAKEDSLNLYSANLTELQNILTQKDKEVKALKDKVSNALKSFEGSGLKVEQRNGKVYVSMDEKLLFASARWEVESQGKKAIQELAKVLESEADINVLIEGHTDNVPFTGSGQVKDNWDLSVMRATSVVKILLASGKIDPKRISASGRGEFFPLDESNTPQARAKNRRTEIILTPKLDELFQIIDAN
ncbi:MAG: OmpA family protein [Bacteroidales bacterium]|jgi:chemotaxis protein MotB|nr:OmpA family protein [Bacteroidales bacterium]MDD4394354.1 OmpA family protein [Bacteroidales bacterium]